VTHLPVNAFFCENLPISCDIHYAHLLRAEVSPPRIPPADDSKNVKKLA
jgi:hypothetical protein